MESTSVEKSTKDEKSTGVLAKIFSSKGRHPQIQKSRKHGRKIFLVHDAKHVNPKRRRLLDDAGYDWLWDEVRQCRLTVAVRRK